MIGETIFLDTVGLLALWDKSDQWHGSAKVAFSSLTLSHTKFITTSYVLLECGNASARRPYRDKPQRFSAELETGGFLIHPNESDWKEAWSAYARGEADNAGIVDQISFLIMRRFGITKAFTNDRHYLAAGFIPLF